MSFNEVKNLQLSIPNFQKDLDLIRFQTLMNQIQTYYNGLAGHVETCLTTDNVYTTPGSVNDSYKVYIVDEATGVVMKISLLELKNYVNSV